jgi:hypothetical protein
MARRVGDNLCKEGKNLTEEGQFGDWVTSLREKEHVLQRKDKSKEQATRGNCYFQKGEKPS